MDSPWDEPTTSTTTTLSSVLTGMLLFQNEALGYQAVELLHDGFTSFKQNFLDILILIDLSANKDVSMIFRGYIEERNSKNPHSHFSSPDLSRTHQLHLYC